MASKNLNSASVVCKSRDTAIGGGNGGGSRRKIYHRDMRAPRRSNRSKSSNSSCSATVLPLLLVLSLWTSPPSTTVDAFASLTATTPRARRIGFRNEDAGSTNVRARRPSKGSPLLKRLVRGSDRQWGLPVASAASAADAGPAADGGIIDAEKVAAQGTLTGNALPPAERKNKEKNEERVRVTTSAEMERLLSEGKSLFDLDARGNSQEMLEGRGDEHPVLEVLRKRAKAGTKPGSHGDGLKVTSNTVLRAAAGTAHALCYDVLSYSFVPAVHES